MKYRNIVLASTVALVVLFFVSVNGVSAQTKTPTGTKPSRSSNRGADKYSAAQ
jgi:hypothetical protein